MPSSIELTQELVRFNTINPPGSERACAERLAGLLEGAGFAVELIPFGEGRAQILARLGGAPGQLPPGLRTCLRGATGGLVRGRWFCRRTHSLRRGTRANPSAFGWDAGQAAARVHGPY